MVYVNDSSLGFLSAKSKLPAAIRDREIPLLFFVDIDPSLSPINQPATRPELVVTAYTSLFGADISFNPSPDQPPHRFGHGDGTQVVQSPDINPLGCLPYSHELKDSAVLVRRGECTFLEKLVNAHHAGAVGVIVIGDDEMPINPTTEQSALDDAGDISDTALVVVTKIFGDFVEGLVTAAEGSGIVKVIIEPEGYAGVPDAQAPEAANTSADEKSKGKDVSKVLYINGHPLLNTVLVV